VIRETSKPLFGFCGGHQLIGEAFGAKVGAMRKLQPGEKDPAPFHGPGMYKEWGFLPVRVIQPDPIFEGMGSTVLVREYHYGEIKSLPADFALLASTDECCIQAIKHTQRLLYGTQFHPEAYDTKHPDGQLILRNFFRLAGIEVR